MTLRLFPLCLLLTLSLLSQSVPCAGEGPQDVVIEYYTADLNGCRLSGETWKKIAPLITWEAEPGWDTTYVTQKPCINSVRFVKPNEAYIQVIYPIRGIIDGEDFINLQFKEIVEFRLVRKAGKWKINKPVFPPHASVKALVHHYKEIISESPESDSKKQREILEYLKDIRD